MHSVDSDGLEKREQDFIIHHHYIACKDYDRTITKKVLESDARLKVDAFLDPIVALENFRPGLYDLLLIDIAMPKMNGFELYDKIRELDKKVKISFVTASEMFYEEIRKEAFPELDTTICFIRKPIANPDLVQQVREILEIYNL